MKKIIILIVVLVLIVAGIFFYLKKDAILFYLNPQEQQLKSEVFYGQFFPDSIGDFILKERNGGKVQAKSRGCYTILEFLVPFNDKFCSRIIDVQYTHKDYPDYSIYVILVDIWKGDMREELVREGANSDYTYNGNNVYKIENSNRHELIWSTDDKKIDVVRVWNGPFVENVIADYFISQFPPIK